MDAFRFDKNLMPFLIRKLYYFIYCINAGQLDAALEFKSVKGLFSAGQFNGSSGYEEAACQGLVAGVNAAIGSIKT